jgi:phage regulator Rha-like protein
MSKLVSSNQNNKEKVVKFIKNRCYNEVQDEDVFFYNSRKDEIEAISESNYVKEIYYEG